MNESLNIDFYPFKENTRKSFRLKVILTTAAKHITKIFTLSSNYSAVCQLKNKAGKSFDIPLQDIRKVYSFIENVEGNLKSNGSIEFAAKDDLTVKEFSDDFFKQTFLNKHPKELYRLDLLMEFWKDYKIKIVNFVNIEHFKNEFLKTKSASTVRKYCFLLRQIFDLAVELEYRSKNPFANVKLPVENNQNERMPMSYNDLIEIFEKSKNTNDETLFNYCLLLFYTGLRCQDALDLTIDNIKIINDYRIIDVIENKTQKRTIIPVHSSLEKLITNCQAGYILKSKTERSNLRAYLSKQFHKITDKYTPYNFRHTFISMLAESGISQPIINELSGKIPKGSIRHYQKIQNLKVLYEAVMKLPEVWSQLGRNKKSPVETGLQKCV